MASTERLRVLNVITHWDAGGATDAALNVCASISGERFAPTLVWPES